jgi:nucleoside diphosphate kinase
MPWIVKKEVKPEEGQEPTGEVVTETLSNDISEAIKTRFTAEGFTIVDQKRFCISQEQAKKLFVNNSTHRTFEETTDYLSSGVLIAMILEKENAVQDALNLAGNADPIVAKQEAKGEIQTWTLRAQFGYDEIKNAVHVSESVYDAAHEVLTLFPEPPQYQRTVGIVKPDAVESGKLKEILGIIEHNDFIIVAQKHEQLSQEKAEALYAEHKGKEFYGELIEYMTSSTSLILVLEKMNAVSSFKNLIGPAKNAYKNAPSSIRGKFAISDTKNSIDGSANVAAAERDLKLFFPKPLPLERTLAMIKPGTANKYANEIKAEIESHGFTIVAESKVHLSKVRAGEFYAEHHGKAFYEPLVKYMSSGPIYALVLAKPAAIKSWRILCGPTNSIAARKSKPNSIRSRFGLDGRQNAVHGSDSVASAEREIGFHFPQLHHELMTGNQAKEFIANKFALVNGKAGDKTLNGVLVEGLSELCRVKPSKNDAIRWLGKWLLEHNPNKPGFQLNPPPASEKSKLKSDIYKTLPNQGAELPEPPAQQNKIVFGKMHY